MSPTEIENALLANPDRLVSDVTVAGVSGGRTSDEKVPRAWVVLSDEGRKRGEQAVVQALHSWIQKSLSKYKWLRGGIEVVDEVSVLSFPSRDRITDLNGRHAPVRYRRTRQARCCVGCCRTGMSSN